MVIDINVGANVSAVYIGRRGEHNATNVRFHIQSLITAYGEGTVEMYVKRKGDAEAYPVAVSQDGEIVIWTVSNVDTAYVGCGAAELWYYVDDILAKTVVYTTVVREDIGAETATPPDPYETWLDQMAGYAQQTEAAAGEAQESAEAAQEQAEDAAEAASHYPQIINGTWHVWNVSTGTWDDTGISAGVTVEFQGTALVINT